MLTLTQTLPFLLASVLLTLTPGPDNLMVLSVGLSRGKQAGIAFGLGCALGCLSHTLLAVLGVSALIASSPTAFFLLKIAGSSYLIWLGIQAIRFSSKPQEKLLLTGASDESLSKLFLKGLLANAINPKVALFFLSFLPQFVDQSLGNLYWQITSLGIIFTLQAAILFSLIACGAGGIRAWLNKTPAAGRWLHRTAGGVFILLGLRMVAF